MNDWFIWNGTRSYAENPSDPNPYGVHALSLPTPQRPEEKVSSVDIPGRSGSLTIKEGQDVFKSLSISINCVIDDPYDLDWNSGVRAYSFRRLANVSKWLRGYGTIVFPNFPGGFFKGTIANQISFDRVLRDNPHRSFNLSWTVDPFFYLDSGETAITLNVNSQSPNVVTNIGNFRADPLVEISLSEAVSTNDCEIALNFGSQDGLDILLPIGITKLYIDSEHKLVYSKETATSPMILQGMSATGQWPYLEEGETTIEVSASSTFPSGSTVKLYPKWRVLE